MAADSGTQARIQDLKRRLELDSGSRLFVALAEEYRKTGRLSDALSTLQKGLLAHPNYVSAQVALGRAYLEAGQIVESIATFSKVLVADPGNLVSAKSLADVYLSRGEGVEAVKKYKLYRALSGDRKVDEIITRLEKEIAPPPPHVFRSDAAALPPPPAFIEKPTGPIRLSTSVPRGPDGGMRVPEDTFDNTSVRFEPSEDTLSERPPEAFPMPSRDVPIPAAPLGGADLATRALRISEILPAPRPVPGPSPGLGEETERPAAQPAASPQGRTLADLYFAQGHYAEALQIYDDLVAANPHDEELRRMRRDSEARLLPAGAPSRSDPGLERRLSRIRALKRWLSMLQAG